MEFYFWIYNKIQNLINQKTFSFQNPKYDKSQN